MKWQNFKYNFNSTLQRFMYGRYGADQLSRTLLLVSLILLLVSSIFRLPLLMILCYAALIFSLYRCYSRKISKRQQENQAYLGLIHKLKSDWRLRKRIFSERKTHVYFKCPVCSQRMRVPRGKGAIGVNCPRCNEHITKKV